MAKTLTPKEIALEWGVSAKTLRKFLRQDKGDKGLASLAPGKGGRWALPAQRVQAAQKRFAAWKIAEAAKRAEALAQRESLEQDTDPETDAIEEEVLEDAETADDEIIDADEDEALDAE